MKKFFLILLIFILLLIIALLLAWGPMLPGAAAAAVVGRLTQVEGRVDRLKGGKLPATPVKVGVWQGLADLDPEDENTHVDFAREIFQAALENLSPTRSLEKSYLRTLIYFAEFEKGCGRSLRAARLYDQALAELETWGDEQSAAALRSHYPR